MLLYFWVAKLIQKKHSHSLQYFLNNEGKYYITVLGATEELKREFEQVFQRNINVIDGYYENGNPSNRELQALKVESLPTYFVFDTEKEVFRTDDIFKLSKFLMERTNNN